MKTRSILIVLALAAMLALSVGLSAAQGPHPTLPSGASGGEPQALVGSTFTYQGQLLKNGSPVNANCLMAFRLYDAATGGNLIGGPITTTVNVAGGLFTVALNFPDAFQGEARFLEIAVACLGDPGFVTLSPRQNLTAAPYALSLKPGAVISGTLSGIGGINVSNWATDGFGVYATSNYFGVYGEVTNGWAGVYGRAKGTGGSPAGVYGVSEVAGGNGVWGEATATSGPSTGVIGRSYSDNGTGVHGWASGSSNTIGVYGTSDGTWGRGVVGYASATTGNTRGVDGTSNSTSGIGVSGYASASSGNTYGVFGQSESTEGHGVTGVAHATSGTNYGVYGQTRSPAGWSGYFYTTAGNGVYITAPAGKTGLNVAGGTKNAVVRTDSGSRLLYTEESAEVWFTDYGFGQLKNGSATVVIDPLYAQTVNLKEPYLVFLTPQGDCGLYVAEKTPTAFTVRALGGRACNIAFDYRIVAKRLGYEDTRLAPAPWADDDPNLYPERAPAEP